MIRCPAVRSGGISSSALCFVMPSSLSSQALRSTIDDVRCRGSALSQKWRHYPLPTDGGLIHSPHRSLSMPGATLSAEPYSSKTFLCEQLPSLFSLADVSLFGLPFILTRSPKTGRLVRDCTDESLAVPMEGALPPLATDSPCLHEAATP